MKEKILNKKHEVKNNNVLVIKTAEIEYTKQDLENALINIQRQKNQLIQQNKRLKEQFDSLTAKEQEVNKMLVLIKSEETIEPIE